MAEEKQLKTVALSKWLKMVGRSSVTGWRWIKAGWLHPINIAGRLYLTPEDQQQFYERAEKGEFAKPPRGAAAKKN